MGLAPGQFDRLHHYNDVIMGAIASQTTSLMIVYSIVCADADQRKHQSSASLAFVRGIIPMYWLCLHGLYRLYGPRCPLSPKRPINLISLSPGKFPAKRPVTRSFDIFFDLRPNKRLSKQSWGWWFETLSHPLWRHCNVQRASTSVLIIARHMTKMHYLLRNPIHLSL